MSSVVPGAAGSRSFLHHILWLKCRLTLRSLTSSPTGILSAAILLFILYSALVPLALCLGGFLVGSPRDRAGELLHISLTAIYWVWITFPLSGFRVNEFFDVTRLLPYPIPPLTLLIGSVLASFLDLSALLVYPFAVVIFVTQSSGPASAAINSLGIFLFMIHTFALAQMVLLTVLHLLSSRKVLEALLTVVPLALLAMAFSAQVAVAMELKLYTYRNLPPSTLLGFLPPGILAQLLSASASGDLAAAGYWLLITSWITLLTLILSARLSGPLLEQANIIELWDRVGRLLRLTGGGGRSRWLSDLAWPGLAPLARLVGGSPAAAIALKEVRLLTREPQNRLACGLYLLVCGLVLWAGEKLPDPGSILPVVSLLSIGSVATASPWLLNSLAFERDGLKTLLAAPLSPRTILAAKSLAHWYLLTVINGSLMVLATGMLDLSWGMVTGFVASAQSLIFCLMGAGNLTSVLTPMRLPGRGLYVKNSPSPGHAFLVALVGGVLSGIAMVSASLAALLVLVPSMGPEVSLALRAFPVSILEAVGVWALFSAAAASVLDRRRETLLREISD